MKNRKINEIARKNIKQIQFKTLLLLVLILGFFNGVFSKDNLPLYQSAQTNRTDFGLNWITNRFVPCPPSFRLATNSPDYDGDCRTDFSVWDRNTGAFWYYGSLAGNVGVLGWGITDGIPLAGDFDGDQKTDFTFFKKNTGEWYIRKSSTDTNSISIFGTAPFDDPVPADYDGDGKTDIAVFRINEHKVGDNTFTIPTLYFRTSNALSSQLTITLPNEPEANFLPVIADFDGDKKADLAIWRMDTGVWKIRNSSNGTLRVEQWGMTDDIPVPGDYTGDGIDDLAVWRPSSQTWHIKGSNGAYQHIPFGMMGDRVVPGKYDNDLIMDIAVWRPTNGEWYVLSTQNGFMSFPFGSNGNLPIPNVRFYQDQVWAFSGSKACPVEKCSDKCPDDCPAPLPGE